MPTHLYPVGTSVTLQATDGNLVPGARAYLVEAQLPPLGTTLQYRVKSEAEAFRRIVPEYLVNPVEGKRTVSAVHPGEAD